MVIEPKISNFTPDQREKHKEVVLDNGNKVHIVQKDPYGFWYLHLDKGTMPDAYSGAYTELSVAEAAVARYLEEKNRKVHSVAK